METEQERLDRIYQEEADYIAAAYAKYDPEGKLSLMDLLAMKKNIENSDA